jgi:hypothetical protein
MPKQYKHGSWPTYTQPQYTCNTPTKVKMMLKILIRALVEKIIINVLLKLIIVLGQFLLWTIIMR